MEARHGLERTVHPQFSFAASSLSKLQMSVTLVSLLLVFQNVCVAAWTTMSRYRAILIEASDSYAMWAPVRSRSLTNKFVFSSVCFVSSTCHMLQRVLRLLTGAILDLHLRPRGRNCRSIALTSWTPRMTMQKRLAVCPEAKSVWSFHPATVCLGHSSIWILLETLLTSCSAR